MIELIFENILFVVVFAFVSISIGWGFLKLLGIKISQNYSGIFKIFLTGFFVAVVLFAILISNGSTILIGFIPLGVFIWWDNRFHNIPDLHAADSITFPFLSKRLLELSIVSIIVILYRVSFMDAGGYFIEPVYNDYVFYAKLSKYLLETGIENTEFDYIFLEQRVIPYHYLDVWINSLFVYLTRQNAVELMILSSYTIGIAGVWLGLMAVLEQWFKPNLYSKAVAVLLIFATGLSWSWLADISLFQTADVFARHSLNYSKLFPIYWIVLMAIVLYKEHDTNRNTSIVTALLALPIINISSAPGVFLFLFLFFLLNSLRRHPLAIHIAVKTIIVVLFIVLFYKTKQADAGGNWSFDYAEYLSMAYIKTFFNVIAGASIQIGLLYIPVILVLLWNLKSYSLVHLKYLVLVGIAFLAFIIPWAVFHRNANSVQLFSNTFIPFITCFLVAVGCDLVKHTTTRGSYRHYVTAAMLSILPCVGLLKDAVDRASLARAISVNEESMQDCIEFLSTEIKNPVGVFFSSDTNWATKAMPFGALDMKLQQFVTREKFHTISLSILDTPLDSSSIHFNNEREQIRNALFYRYLEKQSSFRSDNLDLLQRKFINDFNVEYVLTDYNYSLPEDKKHYLRPLYDVPVINLKVYSVIRTKL